MTTPSFGQISLSQIAQIVKGSPTNQISLGDSEVRFMLGVNSGQISMSSGYNKPIPGSASYTTPGTYTFYTPAYEYLTVDVRGGGGGGGGGCDHYFGLYRYNGNPGGSGSESYFLSVTGGRGFGGGGGGTAPGNAAGPNGAFGGGSNGDTNYTGGGGSGGAGNSGGGPSAIAGGRGGDGGRSVKTYAGTTSGRPYYGQAFSIYVGYPGAAGSGTSPNGNYSGSPGSSGAIYVYWS